MSQNEAAIFDAKNPASPLSIITAQIALLLMDYHNLLISRGGDQATDTVLKAKTMREWAAANGALIIHCLVDMKQAILPSFKSAARFKVMAEMMNSQPDIANEYPDIAYTAGSGEYLVTRSAGYGSALKCSGLRELLGARIVKSIILCGISTSGCVLSTARAAGDDEYIVTVIEDACMDPVPGLHDTLIQRVLPSQVHIATAVEFQEHWNKGKWNETAMV
jgi:nicotinamidase-related amidase